MIQRDAGHENCISQWSGHGYTSDAVIAVSAAAQMQFDPAAIVHDCRRYGLNVSVTVDRNIRAQQAESQRRWLESNHPAVRANLTGKQQCQQANIGAHIHGHLAGTEMAVQRSDLAALLIQPHSLERP